MISSELLVVLGSNWSFSSCFHRCSSAEVAIYAEALELGSTETKGTVLLESAEQLMNFSKGEALNISRSRACLNLLKPYLNI